MKTRVEIEAEIVYEFGETKAAFVTMMALPDGHHLAPVYQRRIDCGLFRINGMLWVLGLSSDAIPQVGSHESVNLHGK